MDSLRGPDSDAATVAMGATMVARLAQLAEHVVGTTPGGHASARAFAGRAYAGLVPVVVHAHAPQQTGSACGLFCLSAVRQAMRLTPFDLFVSDRTGMWTATMANIGAVQASLRAQLCAAFAPGPQWPALRTVAEVVQQHLPMLPPAMAAAAPQADASLAAETARRLALTGAAMDVDVDAAVAVDVGDLDVDAVMDVGGDGDSGDSDDGGGGRDGDGASDDGGGGSDDDAMAMDVDLP